MSTELYIPPARPKPLEYDPKTGRFMKGHKPANKGKKWDDYMTKRSQRRASKGWRNCEIGHAFGRKRPDTSGRCRKKVVAITDDGKLHVFDFIGAAGLWVGGSRENVGRCCRENQAKKLLKDTHGRTTENTNTDHRYKGVRFYFEDDAQWMDKVRQKI